MNQIATDQMSDPRELNEYIDKLLKNSKYETISNEDIQKILEFYQSVDDKVLFQSIYEYFLIQRYKSNGKKALLSEAQIIKPIRTISNSFVNSYENYLLLSEKGDELRDHFNSLTDKKDQFNPIILPPCPVPQINSDLSFDFISDKIDAFKAFYEEQDEQNMIELLPDKSTVYLDLLIPARNGLLTRSISIITDFLCAKLIYKLVEGPCKFSDIRSLYNDDQRIASKVVLNLSRAKVIRRYGLTNRLSDDDEFSINSLIPDAPRYRPIEVFDDNYASTSNFIDKRARQEKEDSISSVIVRTLKQRGRVEFNELISIVTDSLAYTFPCDSNMVENLILKLERVFLNIEEENGQDIVHYIH